MKIAAATYDRLRQRIDEIQNDAKDREQQGKVLALEIDARFRLEDMGAVQYQLASVILEELGGLTAQQIVAELLSIGLNCILSQYASQLGLPVCVDDDEEPGPPSCEADPSQVFGRTVN